MSFGLTVGVVAAAVPLAACDDQDDDDANDERDQPVYGAPVQPDAGRQNDAGNPDDRAMAIYGAPVQPPDQRDASIDAGRTDAAVPSDAGKTDAGPAKPDAGDASLDSGDPDDRVFPVYGLPAQRQ